MQQTREARSEAADLMSEPRTNVAARELHKDVTTYESFSFLFGGCGAWCFVFLSRRLLFVLDQVR